MRLPHILCVGLLLSMYGCSKSNVLSEHKFKLLGLKVSSNQLSCETVADSSFYVSDPMKEEEIIFKLTKGTDKLALTIGDEYISLITAAAVGQGISESEKWPILQNDDESLISAIFKDGPFGSSLYSFALNKKTGFAVWSRVEPKFLYVPTAGGFIQYLTCK